MASQIIPRNSIFEKLTKKKLNLEVNLLKNQKTTPETTIPKSYRTANTIARSEVVSTVGSIFT